MKKPRPLTRKQKAFVQGLINNPKQSATKTALAVYDTNDYSTAQSIATENLSKPVIQNELAKYSNESENILYGNMLEYSNSDISWQRQLSNENARYIHDKVHGKATIKTENTNYTDINITLGTTPVADTTQDVITSE